MNVEILEFYPIEKNEERKTLTGTLRVKLPDLGIHILGIFVFRKNDYWHFTIPGRTGEHHETGVSVRYPFVVFEDRDKQKELIEAIREKGREFILNRLSERRTSHSVGSTHRKGEDRPAEAKQEGYCESKWQPKKPEVKPVDKVRGIKLDYVDPPKRNLSKFA